MTTDKSQELERALLVIERGGVLIYPTDTIWGIGCDATDSNAVQRIYEIKKRPESKSMIILVSDLKMLENHVGEIPDKILEFLKGEKRPTTVIYNNPEGLASNVIAQDNTVAIRVVQDEFCRKLISSFGKPIVSTSANYSDHRAPSCFAEIEGSLLEKADYIVNLSRDSKQVVASQIIKLNESGELEFIRK